MNHLRYEDEFERVRNELTVREKNLLRPLESMTNLEAKAMVTSLESLGFVRCDVGAVSMGADQGLVCALEGRRLNEEPRREMDLHPFYICKTTVTNIEFEQFDHRRARTITSLGDKQPVTCLSYARAISHIEFLNNQTGLRFCLPTEPQMVAAMAPYGWQFPYKSDGRPSRNRENVFKAFPLSYPPGESGSTLDVDSEAVTENYLGLLHASGNVSVFTLGHYYTAGHWGATTDGTYCVVVGGNFRMCSYGSRVITRGIIDVAGVADTAGIRLTHPDPMQYVKR